MSTRHAVHVICLLAMTLLLLSAPNARADLAAWDQPKITALAKELATTTDALHKTFQKQPPPSIGWQSQAYYRLKQLVRLLHVESHEFASALEKGEGREHTLTIYDNLMQLARSTRNDAARVFVTHDVGERAAAVRRVLNQLGPYYDPDFPALAPHPNIEPSASNGLGISMRRGGRASRARADTLR